MEKYRESHKKSIIRRVMIVLVFISLMITTLSCRWFDLKMQIPDETIPVSTQAIEDLEKDVEEAIREAQSTGQVLLTLSESEITSFFTLKLQEQDTFTLQDLQIFLRDGQILVSGKLSQDNTLLPVTLIMEVGVQNGVPIFDVISAKISALPLPEQIVNELSGQMSDLLMQELQARLGEFEFQAIEIQDGNMTIQGRVR